MPFARLDRVGSRIYLVDLPFEAKSKAKEIGCHWDGERRQWWIGTTKKDVAAKLVEQVNNTPTTQRTPTPASARIAVTVGLSPDTPADIVADRVQDAGDERAAQQLRTPPEDVSDCRVYAQVEYKGRRYYVIAESREKETGQPMRCRLTTLDGLTPFWADCSECNLIKSYPGREVWDGRRYSGKTVTRYTTIGSLRDFRASQKMAAANGAPQCAACGKRSDRLTHDLEDGLMKCRGCCDMAEGE